MNLLPTCGADFQSASSETDAPISDKKADWKSAPRFGWRAEIGRGAALGLACVATLLLFQHFEPSFELVDDDAIASWQPVFTDFVRQLRSGHLPVWSHHTQCGYPLLGWPQPTFVYPVHWLAHGICLLLGWEAREIFLSTLLHYLVAATASFVYLRRFGVIVPAALIAACAYTFSGVLLGLGAAWPTYVFAAAYWPMVMLAIEELRVGSAARFWVPFLGLLGGMGFLFADLMVAAKYALFAGLYFVLRANPTTFWINARQVSVAAVLALLIGMGQIVPSAEIIVTSFRMGQGGIADYCATPTLWLGLIFPFWQLPWENGLSRAAGGFFVGPCALLGALFAGSYFLALRGPHRALMVMVVVYLGLSLGGHWHPNEALHALPGFAAFRWPMRWMLEASAALALLSGFGMHLAYQELGRGQGRGLLLAFITLLGFVLLLRFPAPAGMASRTTLMMLVWATGLAGLWCAARAARRPVFMFTAGAWTVVALLANVPVAQQTMLARMTQLVNNPLPVSQTGQERVMFLARHAELVHAQCQGTLALCFPHQFDTRTVFGYVYRPPGQSWMQGVDVNGLIYDDSEGVARRFLEPSSTLLATLRVGHVVVFKSNQALVSACAAREDLKLEQETEWYCVYRHLGFREPAFFVSELKRPSPDDIVELGSRFQLPKQACVVGSYDGPMHFSGDGVVTDFREQHGRISMKVTTGSDGFLAITTTYSPRWRATVDGQPVEHYCVNGSFLGLRLPPGAHEVQLAYWPADHLALLGVSVLITVLSTSVLMWQLLKKTTGLVRSPMLD